MPNIYQELVIGASAEKVYRALTDPAGLSAWWTPGVSASAERDSVARFPFGQDYFKEMRITDLEPAKLVRWNCISGADEWVGTVLTFTLVSGDRDVLLRLHPEAAGQIQQQKDLGEGTLLIFNHDKWRDQTSMFAECSYTWGQFLRSLKLFCETGTGRPSPYEHSS